MPGRIIAVKAIRMEEYSQGTANIKRITAPAPILLLALHPFTRFGRQDLADLEVDLILNLLKLLALYINISNYLLTFSFILFYIYTLLYNILRLFILMLALFKAIKRYVITFFIKSS